jgi:hypothetical protein
VIFLAINRPLSLRSFGAPFSSRSVSAAITQQADENGVVWNIVSSGNDLQSLLSSAPSGSSLNIKASTDLTIAKRDPILPTNLTLVLDMDGHALYSKSNAFIRINSGDNITFQNEHMVSTTTGLSTTVPDPSGIGYTTGEYNYYYGLFTSEGGNTTGASLTYKNVTQDLSSVTNHADDSGQPFYNYGIPVYFSGKNYFYYDSVHEFMQGNGIIVLDGTTDIVHNSGNAFIWSNKAPIISVAAGSALNITSDLSRGPRGLFYCDGNQPFNITNNGSLTIDTKVRVPSPPDFYSGTGQSSITLNFGANSKTNINAYGLFNLDATASFKTTIDSNAVFDYSTPAGDKIFLGTQSPADSFIINSAKHVRFNTTRTTNTGSILAANANIMQVALNAAPPAGYAINGYSSTGAPTITANAITGAYGVSGSLRTNLENLSSLNGVKTPTAGEIATYQNSAQLEFNLVEAAQANFSYAWADTVPGQNNVPGKLLAALPNMITTDGNVGEAISPPDLATIPSGYFISGYKAPDGKVYPTLSEALASFGGVYGSNSNISNPNTYTPETNDIQVILSAQTQTFYINYGYEFNKFGAVPPFPDIAHSQTGMTGAPLVLESSPAPAAGYHYSAVINKNSHFWIDAVNPETGAANGTLPFYSSANTALSAAISSQNDGLYFGPTSLTNPPAVNQQGAYDNNVMLMLTADIETADYNYTWADSTPGYNGNLGAVQGSLPANASSTGGFGDSIAANLIETDTRSNNYPSFVQPPADIPLAGYTTSVLAPDGITYSSDLNAAAGPNLIKTSKPLTAATRANTFRHGNSANNFQISYAPISQKITWNFQCNNGMSNLPADIVQQALTGAPLPNPNISVPDGYLISSYHYPDDPVAYTSLESLQIAHHTGTSNITITVNLAKKFTLPFAGGEGTIGLVTTAGVAMGTALLIRRRKRK